MVNVCDIQVMKPLLAEHGFHFSKAKGQNFLIAPWVPQSIAAEAGVDETAGVLEIGPGIGCLTRELALRYEKVVAIEIDRGLLPVLAKTLADCPNAHVVNADVMKIDIPRLIKEEAEGRDVVVCANLPYYITTPILMRLLECGVPFRSITVMVQAEVATRLTAKAGESDYGAITAVLGYYGDVKRLFTVPAGCFMPAPKVNSAVIRIGLHEKCPYDVLDRSLFFGLIKAAFGQRRKTLVNAITSSYQSFSKDCVIKALNQLGFSETVRGERLSTSDFAALSDLLYEAKEGFSSK